MVSVVNVPVIKKILTAHFSQSHKTCLSHIVLTLLPESAPPPPQINLPAALMLDLSAEYSYVITLRPFHTAKAS